MSELTEPLVGARIPTPLFKEMERIRKNNGYNKSEYIREAIRYFNEKLDGG